MKAQFIILIDGNGGRKKPSLPLSPKT